MLFLSSCNLFIFLSPQSNYITMKIVFNENVKKILITNFYFGKLHLY
nr:MAG TPA: hypothetical protein [Caudoviricetes sp.]